MDNTDIADRLSPDILEELHRYICEHHWTDRLIIGIINFKHDILLTRSDLEYFRRLWEE